MTTNFEKVRAFHEKFGLAPNVSRPRILDDKLFLFRYDLCLEEMHELLRAHRRGSIVDVADALADLLYVAYGLAVYCNIPMDAVFAEVHRANMTKIRSLGDGDRRSTRSSRFDVVKPDDWQPPDIASVLSGETT
jgi:Uncharacterized protein conserved in bacteria